MIVLHGSVCEGRLWVWGESPAEPGRRARGDRSPFDPGRERLAQALAEVGVGDAVPKGALAWLPSVQGKPVASGALIAEPPVGKVEVRIAPWAVAAAGLDIEESLGLLARCAGKTTLATGVAVGRSLAFWAEAARFAGSLAARERFLPGVVATAEGDRYEARWEPVPAAADVERSARLARAMPAACRALGPAKGDRPPGVGASAALSGFVAGAVDHLVRGRGRERSRRANNGRPGRAASVHERWIAALQSPDGRIDGTTVELARLADQVRDWRRRADESAATPFRLAFRLEEPGGDDPDALPTDRDPWQVRYFLQAVDDPSLLVPVTDAWDPRARVAAILSRAGFRPRDYLLGALGEAAIVCPEVEASLRTPAPGGFATDASGAHTFLDQTAFLLEQAGFGVMLPAWWSRKGTKLRLAAQAYVKSPKTSSGGGLLSLDEVVRFDWKVALGGEPLTQAELRELARIKAPLVRVRGRWVQLDGGEIRAALDFWKARGGGSATALQIVRMALGAVEPPGGLAFDGVKATGWVAKLLDRLEGRAAIEPIAAPAGFTGTLRPYQARGYAWLAFLRDRGLGACLADDMGLGKTIQALALIQRGWEGGDRRPTLLVCPMSVVGNWKKEAERFAPDLPVLVHHGLARAKGAAFKKQAAKHALVLSSYPLLHRDFDALRGVPWAGLILDEAQNIKNPQAKQARAARALPAEYRVALTGTPVENNVGDLWSISEFLNPGLLGNQAEFRREFLVPIQARRDPEAADKLRKLTGPFVLRRLKSDKSIIADLPEKREQKVFCTLTKEQASLYQAVVEDAEEALAGAEGIRRKGVVLATLSKLKQVCNHPAQLLGDNSAIAGRSGKLARLAEMLDEAIAAGDRALVFSQFAEMGDLIRRHLEATFGREVPFLHGGLTKTRRDQLVDDFRKGGDDGPRVFVLSLKAGGTGLNLTAANHVFHYDRWWNPAVEDQATDRAYRIGQTRDVQVHKFLCVGTLEEKIDAIISTKREVAGSIVGSGEDWLSKLSNAELKDILALRPDAVAE